MVTKEEKAAEWEAILSAVTIHDVLERFQWELFMEQQSLPRWRWVKRRRLDRLADAGIRLMLIAASYAKEAP